MPQTSGDALRYPILGDPANVPQDMQELATDVQTALNKKAVLALSTYAIPRATGWTNGTVPQAAKFGNVVVLSGIVQRSATLSASAGTAYVIATINSAAHQPVITERYACAWSAGGTRRVGQIWVAPDGVVTWIPTVSDSLAIDDWVSVGGISYRVA